MRLNEFQDQFRDLMLDQPEALQSPPPLLAVQFVSGDIPLHERLQVYRSNVVGNLSDVIIDKFPLLKSLVGEDFLKAMARSFVMQNPPQSGCLHFYGDGFAAFIEGFSPAKDHPYLPDVARLETAMNAAYYAEDDEALAADMLAALAPDALEALHLKPRRNVQLLRSDYPLLAIRAYCLSDGTGQAPDMSKGGGAIMVTRPQQSIDFVPLEPHEYEMLLSLRKGETLGTASEALLERFPDFDIAAFLQKHLTLHTFKALETTA